MTKRLIILLTTFLFITCLQAQVKESGLPAILKSLNEQKTANTKDILTTLYRAGIDNLLGKEHSFTSSSSFYGIDSIFRGRNGDRPNYEQERKLRRNSFNLAITGDSSNNITKFSGGFTFTIINKKDVIYTKFDKEDENLLLREERRLELVKQSWLRVGGPVLFHPDATRLRDSLTTSWNEAYKNNDYTDLHPYLKQLLKDPALVDHVLTDKDNLFTRDEILEFLTNLRKGVNLHFEAFKAIAEKYARKPLWTITPTFAYDRQNSQGEYSLSTEFTAGLGRNLKRKPWELEVKSEFKLAADSTQPKSNYDNKPFFISLGLNKVMMESENNEPKMEFKLFTQYDHQFGNAMTGTDASIFSLNCTFRVNVFKALWLPVTIKYDPENNNFFGVFSVTANLGN